MQLPDERSSPAQEEDTMPRDSILAILMDGRQVEQALQRAVRAALVRHKKLGGSVAVWRDGRAVVLPPEEIPD